MKKLFYTVLIIVITIMAIGVPADIAFADKPDDKPDKSHKHEPEKDHETGAPDDSASDENPSDTDSHNNDDSHEHGRQRPNAPSEAAGSNSNCDNNGFDCAATVEPPVVTTPTPVSPTPTPMPTPVSPTPAIPVVVTPLPIVQQDDMLITSTVIITPNVNILGVSTCLADCDICEELAIIQQQNQRIIGNQGKIVQLLREILNILSQLIG